MGKYLDLDDVVDGHPKATGELEALRARVAELEAELETERMRLVACGVAALANTPESSAHRIGRENPYWSSSYEDVCAAVDREIALRTWAAKAEAVRKHAFGILEEYRRYGDVCATNWSVLRDHLSSCPPLESITKAASPSEIDRLEDENAALRKAVSKLQGEVLEMEKRNASLELIAEEFLSLVVAYDQYAHPYQMALALEKARTALRRVSQTRAALAAEGGR